MILEIELSDAQLGKIAEIVAAKLDGGNRNAYSIKEAAEKLGVSPKTVHRRIEAKIIPTIPNLGVVRIPSSFIDKLLNPNTGA